MLLLHRNTRWTLPAAHSLHRNVPVAAAHRRRLSAGGSAHTTSTYTPPATDKEMDDPLWRPSADMLLPGMANKVIVLAGATSVGKSKVAQLLWRELGAHRCEVVVADSVQVYRHLDVGSNKPSAAEQAEVPHHCLDLGRTILERARTTSSFQTF